MPRSGRLELAIKWQAVEDHAGAQPRISGQRQVCHRTAPAIPRDGDTLGIDVIEAAPENRGVAHVAHQIVVVWIRHVALPVDHEAYIALIAKALRGPPHARAQAARVME